MEHMYRWFTAGPPPKLRRKEPHGQTGRRSDRKTVRQEGGQTGRWSDRKEVRQEGGQTGRQSDRKEVRQEDGQREDHLIVL